MYDSKGYAAHSSKDLLKPFSFKRRGLRENDVFIEIQYCGVCHSDIHQVRDEWSGTRYPIVPGHEIIGIVKEVGPKVSKHQVGDVVGVGCLVDSCQKCFSCKEHLEQYCETSNVPTYNGKEYQTGETTYGGYSTNLVCREDFVLKIPENLDLAKAAPLLCAGVTTYSPLKHWGVKAGDRVGIVGLGGLGHMAVKIANAMSAEVVVFTTSESKVEDAKRLGASEVVISKDESQMKKMMNSMDLILNTVGASINLNPYIDTLKRDKTMVMVGLPEKPHSSLEVARLISKRRSLGGSLIGGIKETQEALDFCGKHNLVADIEIISINQINEAYDRAVKGDVKYRFVIDIASLSK